MLFSRDLRGNFIDKLFKDDFVGLPKLKILYVECLIFFLSDDDDDDDENEMTLENYFCVGC